MVGELTVTNKFLATLGAGIPIVDTNYITVLKYMKIQEAFRTILKLDHWTNMIFSCHVLECSFYFFQCQGPVKFAVEQFCFVWNQNKWNVSSQLAVEEFLVVEYQ